MTERTAELFVMSMMQSVFSDQAWSGAFDRRCLPEEENPIEDPSTNDIRDFLASSERHEMTRPSVWVWSLMDCGTTIHSMVETRCVAAPL